MSEISREEHKKLLHNKLRTYIDEKQYQYEAPYITRADVEVILSDMEKLEKIEEIAKTNYCEKCSLYNETCYGEDIEKCRYSDIEQIVIGE